MTIRTRWAGPAGMVLVLAAAVPAAGQKPVRKPAEMTLALTGLSTFTGPLKGSCEIDAAEHRVTVEGRGPDDLFVRLYVDYPSKATFKVMMEGLGGGSGQIVGRVNSLMINSNNYVAGAGSGALDDAAGASGRMRAEGFIKAGGTMQAQNLTANITWKCQ
jgi:hypothetical protein